MCDKSLTKKPKIIKCAMIVINRLPELFDLI